MILDVCCGSKMFYFDKSNEDVLFMDIRKEDHILCDGRDLKISPDLVGDFRNLPFNSCFFNHVIFDPPHMKWLGKNSWMFKKYGVLNRNSWEEDLKKGFNECWRVLKNQGSLIFKWNTHDIATPKILKLFHTKPTIGHRTTKNLKTHWFVFYKNEAADKTCKCFSFQKNQNSYKYCPECGRELLNF